MNDGVVRENVLHYEKQRGIVREGDFRGIKLMSGGICPRRCPDPIGPLCVCLSAGLLQSNQPVLLTFGVTTGPTYRKNLTVGGDPVPYTDSGSLSTSLTIAE